MHAQSDSAASKRHGKRRAQDTHLLYYGSTWPQASSYSSLKSLPTRYQHLPAVSRHVSILLLPERLLEAQLGRVAEQQADVFKCLPLVWKDVSQQAHGSRGADTHIGR